MGQKMYNVTIQGITKQYPEKIPYSEIVKEYEGSTDAPVMLVIVNGRLRELHKHLKADCEIEFVTSKDPIGHKTYCRSASLILLKAIYDVAGQENIDSVMIHYSVGSGYYFTMKGPMALDQEFIDKVKAQMHRIVDENLPIVKRSVSTSEAVALFHKHHMYDKEKLFNYRRSSAVNLYSIGSFEDYFYGFMANHTGYIKTFDLFLYEGGFVLQLPTQNEPDRIPEFKPREKIFRVQKESQEWGDKLDIATVGDLNEKVTRGGIQDILLIQEAMQEAKISEIASEIAAAGNKKFVMIAGPSSSGKTTFSHRLSIQLAAHGMKPHPIAVDNYFIDRHLTPVDEFGEKNFECLEAIDVEQFNKDMLELLEGKRVEMPVFNFKTGTREYKGDFLQLDKDDILVIEGIHGLNDRLSYALPKESKFKIYLSALTQLNIDEHNRIPTTDGRLIRRIVRDARTRGTSAKETIARWPSVRRGEEQNIFPFQEDADVMFNSALIYEMPVFNFKTGTREYKGDFLQLDKDDILVIEGIHGLNDRLSYALPKESKFKIYLSALTQLNIDEHNRIPTTDGRLIRRIVRDARTRGTSAKETIARWPSVRRGEEQNIFPFQEDADVMFNSALIYELACLKVYAEPLLFGIAKNEPEYTEAKRLLKFFEYFVPVPSEAVPNNSILREFIGGSCFNV